MQITISKLKFFLNQNKSIFLKWVLVILFFGPTLYINYLFIFEPFVLKRYLQKLKPEKPKVLQTVGGSILGNDLDIYVNKIKHRDKIYLDFLTRENETLHLIDHLTLKGKHDGFFEYWGDTLSLALLDDDGDGFLEIIAPTFDEFLKPHLNVIFYNREKKKFQLKKVLRSHPKIN